MPSRHQTVVTVGLLFLWLVLMVLGGVTYLEPGWLQDLSRSGRRLEASTLKSYGNDFLRQGNYPMAVGQYLGALERDPDRVDVQLNLAVAWGEMGNNQEATAILKNVLRRETSRSEQEFALYNLGELAAKQGNTGEAIEYLERATGLGVEQRPLHVRLALLYLGAEQFEKACAGFEKALASQLDVTLAYRTMLQNSLKIYKDDEVRLTAIRELLSRDLGAEQLARYDLQTIRRMQQSDVEVADIHNHLAYTYSRLGKTDEAAKHLQRVLDIMPDSEGARRNLLILQEVQGNTQP